MIGPSTPPMALPVARSAPTASVIDVLDRVLDKGIVIDAWIRVSLAGIDLITVEARVVVASIETFVRHGHSLGVDSHGEKRQLQIWPPVHALRGRGIARKGEP